VGSQAPLASLATHFQRVRTLAHVDSFDCFRERMAPRTLEKKSTAPAILFLLVRRSEFEVHVPLRVGARGLAR
jgi:hypothetical protein